MSRLYKIESMLKSEISMIIQREFRYNVGLISILSIKVSKDISSAIIHYSHFGTELEQKKSKEKLIKSIPFIKRSLGKKIHLKRIPDLRFELNSALEEGSNIIQALNALS